MVERKSGDVLPGTPREAEIAPSQAEQAQAGLGREEGLRGKRGERIWETEGGNEEREERLKIVCVCV